MDLHYLQTAILLQLGKADKMSFSDFNQEELGIDSDLFNYHLQTLVRLGLVEKENKLYNISRKGKDVVTLIDFSSGQKEKLPKLSVMAWIWDEDKRLLLSKRLKHPFFHQLGLVTGKVRYGEKFAEAMIRECQEEVGLTPTEYSLRGAYRWIDYDGGNLVHDVLFIAFDVTKFTGELLLVSDESENSWMTLDAIRGRKDLLPSLEYLVQDRDLSPVNISLAENTVDYSNF